MSDTEELADWTPGTAALDLVCPYCGARSGDPCETGSGRPAPPHVARFSPLMDAFAAGYEEARDLGLGWREASRG